MEPMSVEKGGGLQGPSCNLASWFRRIPQQEIIGGERVFWRHLLASPIWIFHCSFTYTVLFQSIRVLTKIAAAKSRGGYSSFVEIWTLSLAVQ